MGEEHLEAILTYARAQGDSETEGIIDALLNMLEYPSWIAYIFSLKQNSAVMELMVAQVSKPGWDSIGGTPVTWSTRWWEQWSDAEWEEWWATRREWSDHDWERWWSERDSSWDSYSWADRTKEWADKTWTDPRDNATASSAAYASVAVPSADNGGYGAQ